MPEPRSFAAFLVEGAWTEVRTEGRDHPLRKLAADYVLPIEPLVVRVKRGVGKALRWVARFVYLGPLSWLVSLLLPDAAAGTVLVSFVGVVVAFFALLNVYVVVSALGWRARDRITYRLRPPHRVGLARHAALPAPAARDAPPAPGTTVRVRGRVVVLSPRARHDAVIVDAWSAAPPLRLTRATAFAVCAEGTMPVVVDVAHAPIVLADATSSSLADAVGSMGPATRELYSRVPATADEVVVDLLTVRPGDEVEVTGVVQGAIEDLTQFVLDGDELTLPAEVTRTTGSPYRKGERQRGVVLGSPDSPPVVVERVAPG